MKTTPSNLSLDLPTYLQTNELPEEIKQLLVSLPKEKGWIQPHYYQYQGVWLGAKFLLGVIACHQHFHSQDSDILLVTHPNQAQLG